MRTSKYSYQELSPRLLCGQTSMPNTVRRVRTSNADAHTHTSYLIGNFTHIFTVTLNVCRRMDPLLLPRLHSMFSLVRIFSNTLSIFLCSSYLFQHFSPSLTRSRLPWHPSLLYTSQLQEELNTRRTNLPRVRRTGP